VGEWPQHANGCLREKIKKMTIDFDGQVGNSHGAGICWVASCNWPLPNVSAKVVFTTLGAVQRPVAERFPQMRLC